MTFYHNIILAVILLPSVVFAAVVIYKTLKVTGIVKKFNKLKELQIFRRWIIKDDAGNEPHRLTDPTEYTPLQ